MRTKVQIICKLANLLKTLHFSFFTSHLIVPFESYWVGSTFWDAGVETGGGGDVVEKVVNSSGEGEVVGQFGKNL